METYRELAAVPLTGLDDLSLIRINEIVALIHEGQTTPIVTKKASLGEAIPFLQQRRFLLAAGEVTTLGMLVCGIEPENHLVFKSHLDCFLEPFHTDASDGKVLEDKKTFVGTVLSLMEAGNSWALKNITASVSSQDGGTRVSEYPIKLLRESINNALAHRDYSLNRPVQITIKPNHSLAIRNPGRLPHELVVDLPSEEIPLKCIIPNSLAQNPRLASILKLNYKWEGRGVGMADLVNYAIRNEIDVPYYIFHHPSELSLYILAGSTLDKEIADWLESVSNEICETGVEWPLNLNHATVIAYLIKCELANKRGYFTLALTPENDHFAVLPELRNRGLINLHPASGGMLEAYVISRSLISRNPLPQWPRPKLTSQKGEPFRPRIMIDSAVGSFDIIINRYRARLIEAFAAYEDLETTAINAADTGKTKRRPTRIDDIFVAPACSTERVPCRVDEFDELHTKGEHPNTPLISLLTQGDHRRVVLLADPGYGKSILLQWLIVSLAQRPYKVDGAPELTGVVPIPIIIRDVDRKLSDDFVERPSWEKILAALRTVSPPRSAKTAAPLFTDFAGPDGSDADIAFRSLLDSSRAWFLLDGLDEIGDAKRRRAFRDAVWEGFQLHPQARWLITSRVVGYDSAIVHEDAVNVTTVIGPDERFAKERWGSLLISCSSNGVHADPNRVGSQYKLNMQVSRLLYLAPFDDPRQKNYVGRWFHHQTGAADDVRAESLIEESHKHLGIRVISRVPSLLCLMAILKRKGLPLPDGRAELYDRITEAYLKTIDETRGITREGHGTFSDAEARQWLSIVGIHMQQRRVATLEEQKRMNENKKASDSHAGEVGASRADMEAWLLEHLRSGCAGEEEAREKLTLFLQYVAARSGLLQPRGEGWYGFVHLSFLEYFAACYLRGQLDHHKEMMADLRVTEEAGDAFDEAAYLLRFPRGPVPFLPVDLPPLAAREEWHEVLVFLAELHADTGTAPTIQLKTRLLRQLFPSLHSNEPVPVIHYDAPKKLENLPGALLPFPAAALAVKLARDRHLNLPDITQNIWFVRLWDAYLSWKIALANFHPWPVNSLLLDRPAHEAGALKALREAALRHAHRTVLVMDDCRGLTEGSVIPDLWPQLRELSLFGCTGLRAVDHLPASLTHLYMRNCTGLSAVDHLPDSLTHLDIRECTGLSTVDRLPSSLTHLDIRGCTGLSVEAAARVKKALPKCRIYGP